MILTLLVLALLIAAVVPLGMAVVPEPDYKTDPVGFIDRFLPLNERGEPWRLSEDQRALLREGLVFDAAGRLRTRTYLYGKMKKEGKRVTVLELHEIESILCDPQVVEALAKHFGKDPVGTWTAFLATVRNTFTASRLSHVVAQRVRARVKDLLVGAFDGSQVQESVEGTRETHKSAMAALDLPNKLVTVFDEEEERVLAALDAGDKSLLRLLPGKHLLSLLVSLLGMKRQEDLVTVVGALSRLQKQDAPLKGLGEALEAALIQYILPRRVTSKATSAVEPATEAAVVR